MSEDTPHQEVLEVEPGKWKNWMWFVAIFGIALPTITILVELGMRICSSIFFDPIPTYWHIAILTLIPISNFAVLRTYRRGTSNHTGLLIFLTGVSIGVNIIYSLIFLPILPVSLLGILALGLGLCGLSPFLALISSIICANRLKELRPGEDRGNRISRRSGIAIGTALLGIFFVGNYVTDIGMRMTHSRDAAKCRQGIELIRMFGSKQALLRACYDLPVDPLGSTFWLSFRDDELNSTREDARDIYYRVTGNSFNSVPPPKVIHFRSRVAEDFDWDSDVGGTAVNGKAKNLNLVSSRIDAKIEPDSLTSYTEWAMVFKNTATNDREARTEIALPPGGVVSRLTLWVNGEEREAAFSTRGKVRQAYQQVAVVQQQDPVLVTTCGPDRVLMQCFPVPANGGSMKIRIGITAPLTPESDGKSNYALPKFVEKNFGISEGVQHSLFIDSPQHIAIGKVDTTSGNTITRMLSDADIRDGKGTIECTNNPSVTRVWTPDRLDPSRYAIVQELKEDTTLTNQNVILVIDGSKWLKGSISEIGDLIQSLPGKPRDFSVILAGDEVNEIAPFQPCDNNNCEIARRKVLNSKFAGGIDNRPALIRACEMSIDHPNTTILWIHGPQPLKSEANTDQILQMIERRPQSIDIRSYAVADGRNSIATELEQTGKITTIPDLASFVQALEHPKTAIRRERVPISQVGSAVKGSSHIARLWAYDEVIRICRLVDNRKLSEASEFAAKYQLVTPVSGAVVLETQQQYVENGLEPGDTKKSPTVTPEPASWMVLGMGLVLIGYIVYQRKRAVA